MYAPVKFKIYSSIDIYAVEFAPLPTVAAISVNQRIQISYQK